jgi:hypothetical protein
MSLLRVLAAVAAVSILADMANVSIWIAFAAHSIGVLHGVAIERGWLA